MEERSADILKHQKLKRGGEGLKQACEDGEVQKEPTEEQLGGAESPLTAGDSDQKVQIAIITTRASQQLLRPYLIQSPNHSFLKPSAFCPRLPKTLNMYPQVFSGEIISAVMNHRNGRLLEFGRSLQDPYHTRTHFWKTAHFLLQYCSWRSFWRANICLSIFREKKD